jgi:Uma2 family endonuclease
MGDMLLESQLREFTVAEYHRMADNGIIAADERIELLDGRLVRMPPIGQRHWGRHATIVRYLNEVLRDRATIVGQGSFPLGMRSEPQPDMAVLTPRAYDVDRRAPTPEEIFAFIELADSSLRTDLGLKRELYARHGIADYLVVDLERDCLLHHADPDGRAYRRCDELKNGGEFVLTSIPDVVLSADPFLNPRL